MTNSTCPACGRKGVITELQIMGTTLFQFVCKSWSCGKTCNLSEEQAAAWMKAEKAA